MFKQLDADFHLGVSLRPTSNYSLEGEWDHIMGLLQKLMLCVLERQIYLHSHLRAKTLHR